MSWQPQFGDRKQTAGERNQIMAHKLKALGLALVAVFAMSSVVASAASAGEFTAEKAPVTITAEPINGTITNVAITKHEFKTTAGVIKCTPATADGTVSALTATTITLKAIYGNTAAGTGCTIGGIGGPVVHMNSCDFQFTAGNTIASDHNTITVAAHVLCEIPGDSIDITGGGNCTIQIPPQTFPENQITLHNRGGAGSAMDIEATIDIVGIGYTVTGTCPNGAVSMTGAAADGEFKGVTTIKGEDPVTGAAIGITVT
jgi:hypothetical protein